MAGAIQYAPLSISRMWCAPLCNWLKKVNRGTTWHLSTKESCSIKNLVELICDLSGASFKQLVRSSKERLGKDQSYLLDSSAMRQVHGWSDQISLHDGLQRHWPGWMPTWPYLRPCPGATSTSHENSRYGRLRLRVLY